MKNHLLSIIVLVAFFGAYPRELQSEAPTVFALLSVFIYYVHKRVWDRIDSKKRFNDNMEIIKKQSEELKELLKKDLTKKQEENE